jgi:FkbM family methyltransferase
MNWITSKPFLLLRRLGRFFGLNSIVAKLLYGSEYEMSYDKNLQSQINRGDVIWDIGANIGYYTNLFSDIVGSSGNVIAFEPSPINYQNLCRATEKKTNISLFNFGLGLKDSTVLFEQGEDSIGATSRIIGDHEMSKDAISVPIMVADNLVQENKIKIPNVIKIDVEGYELEVIKGFQKTLNNKDIRVIGIEVHFQILAFRNMNHAPNEIIQILEDSGFKIRWTDSSHLIAIRH